MPLSEEKQDSQAVSAGYGQETEGNQKLEETEETEEGIREQSQNYSGEL